MSKTVISIKIGVGVDEVEGYIKKDVDVIPALKDSSQTIGEEISDLLDIMIVDYINKKKGGLNGYRK